MRSTFFTEEQLQSMPITVLRGVDIMEKDEELLVQKVVNERLMNMPIEGDVFRGDVPDITTKEEEEKWQAIIDERVKAKKSRILETEGASDPDIEVPLSDPLEISPDEPKIETEVDVLYPGIQAEKPFCDECDSKGVRHKKICPKSAKKEVLTP